MVREGMRVCIAFGLCMGAGSMGACSQADNHDDAPHERETLATARGAMTGGELDTSTSDNNTVVYNNCAGMLITPQIVVTASHCLWGAESNDNCQPSKSLGSVVVGLNAAPGLPVSNEERSRSFRVLHAPTRYDGCQPVNECANDLALQFLDQPVVRATLASSVKVPKVVRPTLRGTDDPAFGAGSIGLGAAGYALPGAGETGDQWGPRRLVSWPAPVPDEYGFQRDTDEDGFIWRMKPYYWSSDRGDSGGPLFMRFLDGHREPIGTLCGKGWFAFSGYNIKWASIVDGPNKPWILDNVQEGSALIPAGLKHTPDWLTRHGKSSTTWWGELDYSGECDTTRDVDCDGWWDQPGNPAMPIHDNCRYVANPDQKDANNDGIGDACQACPWDPDNDFDNDRICAKGPPSDSLYAVDNCPRIQNGVSATGGPIYPLPVWAQTNCNEEAERAWNSNHPEAPVPILGDACDPVPCADAKAVPTGAEYRSPSGGTHPQFGGFHSGRIFMNDVSTRRVAPHKKTNTSTNASFAAITQVPTYGRFCQQNEELLFRCHAASVLRDDQLTRFPSRALEVRDPQRPWLRVVTSLNDNAPNNSWPWSYDTFHSQQSGASSSNWRYANDWSYWTGAGTIPPAEPSYQATCSDTGIAGPGTCLAGTMWFHASSAVGATQATVGTQSVGIHGVELANHYFDVKPDLAYARTYSGAGLMQIVLFTIRGYPYPAPYESLLRARSRPVVVEAFQSPAHVLEDHGGSWDAEAAPDALVTTEASMSLAGALRWVGVSEHPGLPGNLDSRLQAMLVADDGTAVWDTLLLSNGKLTAAWALGLEYGSEDSPFAPSPRHDFVTTLSRSAGGLFVVGGRDATTDAVLKDVHLYRPALGWSTVTTNLGGGPFVAAAFSPVDQQLWVLERRDGSSATLYRVDPWTGTRARIGDWPHSAAWDKHFLAVDRDGYIVLVASSRTLERSKIARLRVNGSNQAYAAQIDQEQLPYTSDAPIIDATEYGLVVRDASNGLTGVFRRATLVGPTGTYSLSGMFQ